MLKAIRSKVLDASIYWSFDASGFERHALGFAPTDLDVDLRGQTCLVTGANSGIGRATACALAERGAVVRLLCRNPERGAEAEATLREETGHDAIHFDRLDVSDLDAIRAYADRAPARIDMLVHNAGVLPQERSVTAAGHETTFATHVLGPLLLTRLLETRLERASAARVIWVSSGGMYTRRLSLDDVDWSRRDYDGVVAYAQTKRMQVVLSELLNEQWSAKGSKARSHAMHPGWADTPAVATSLPGFHAKMEEKLRSPAQGADTVVWLAARGGELEGGKFWFDRAARSPYLLPFKRASARERARFRDYVWGLTKP